MTGRSGRRSGRSSTPAEIEQRRNAARQPRSRGHQGSQATDAQRALADAVKAKMRGLAPTVVEFLEAVLLGRIDGVEPSDRLRAAENLLDRSGFPRRAEHEVEGGAFPIIVVDGGLNWPEKAAE